MFMMEQTPVQKKPVEQNRGDIEEIGPSREDTFSPMATETKGTTDIAQRDVEDHNAHSPASEHVTVPSSKEKSSYPVPMDTDSPASYPKHVLVPASEGPERPPKALKRAKGSLPHTTDEFNSQNLQSGDNVVTPPTHENRPRAMSHPGFRQVPTTNYPIDPYYYPSETEPSHGIIKNVQISSKRWACDYCCEATFPTYEEACAHEKICSQRQHSPSGRSGTGSLRGPPQSPFQQSHYQQSHYPQIPYPQSPYSPHQQAGANFAMASPVMGGLGALYQAVKEVQHHTSYGPRASGWPTGAGGMAPSIPSERLAYPPLSPRFPNYPNPFDHGTPLHMDPSAFAHAQYQHHPHHPPPPPPPPPQRRMLLAMPSDADSLSDRQCYVRSEMVEVFAATEKEVAARHSKGAQKLVVGQVGLRCIHCAHVRPKDRAERAVCYPSSISRIYQTVADMQRFHFEQCQEIPDEVRKIYKSLKTTRPRGVGSPQTYWVQSAKLFNLVDTENGIRFADDNAATKGSGGGGGIGK